MYIVLCHFKCPILLLNHGYYFFPTSILTRFLFDMLPVTREANPTDVSKAAGVKLTHSFDCLVIFVFLAATRTFFFFCSPSVKKERAPWENFSLLKSWEEYKVLVLWCVLPVCVHPLRSRKKGKKSAVCKLWLTDSWWLFVKLLKICLSPEHFCVYVSVLTSPIDHVSDYDQSASVS